jgi:hypothetical protein
MFWKAKVKSWVRVDPAALDGQESQHPIFDLGASIKDIMKGIIQCPDDEVLDGICRHFKEMGVEFEVLAEYRTRKSTFGPYFWNRIREFSRCNRPLTYCKESIEWQRRSRR